MDNVKKVGGELSTTKKRATHAVNNVADTDYLIDKVRDYLTPNHDFDMEFSTYNEDDDVRLSLMFSDKIVGLAVPCDDCGQPPAPIVCNIADNFNRADQIGFGTSLDVGGVFDLSWTPNVNYGTTNIDTNRGKLTVDGPAGTLIWAQETLGIQNTITGPSSDMIMHFYLDFNLWDLYYEEVVEFDIYPKYSYINDYELGGSVDRSYENIHFNLRMRRDAYAQAEGYSRYTLMSLHGASEMLESINISGSSADIFLESNTWYSMRLSVPAGWYPTARIWRLGTPEPVDWMITGTVRLPAGIDTLESFSVKLSTTSDFAVNRTVYVDNLEIPDVDNCGDCTDGGPLDLIELCPEGEVLDSFNRISSQFYTLDNSSPAWTNGWGTGERLAWSSGGANIHHYVDGNQGIFWVSQGLYPQLTEPIDGNHQAQAVIPSDVDKVNIVVQFSVQRFMRLVRPAISEYVVGTNIMAGAPFAWANNGCWRLVGAGVGAGLTEVGYSHTNVTQCGACYGLLVRGSNVSVDQSKTNYYSNPYGFVPYLDRYAGGTTFIQRCQDYEQIFYRSADGIYYVPSRGYIDMYNTVFDDQCFIWDNTLNVNVVLGTHTVAFGRTSGGIGILMPKCSNIPPAVATDNTPMTEDRLSSPAFIADTYNQSSGTVTNYEGAKVIEPNYPYYMRIFRPNAKTTMLKIWEGWAQEPKDWLSVYRTDGWDSLPLDTGVGRTEGITIRATGALWMTSILAVNQIISCDSNAGMEDYLPTNLNPGVVTPGGNYQEVLTGYLESSDYNEVTEELTKVWGKDFVTRYPYVPGSLSVFYNCFRTAKGTDFIEVDPSAGMFRLGDNFTVTNIDRLFLRYQLASIVPI